jgi:protein TonB
MAYTDPKPLSQTRIWAIIIVIAIHVLGIWAMFNGGYAYTKKVLTDLEVIEVKEPPPPPEKLPPPPPPDTKLPPPPVVPPPIVQTQQPIQQPQIVQQPVIQQPVIQQPVIQQPVEQPKPAPVALSPRGDASAWFSPDDIPDSIKRDREGDIGTTAFTVQVGSNGRVTSCAITASSGEPRLDELTCRLATSRARFKPGTDSAGQPTGGVYSRRVRWRIQG